MREKEYAVFDTDTGEQLSEWMSRTEAHAWLGCLRYEQQMPYWRDRQYNPHIRSRNERNKQHEH